MSRSKTSVFDFFQHFVNCLDADVERLLRFFTKIDVKEIQRMCKEDIVKAKKLMAFEVTKLVHGEVEAEKARKTSEELFSTGKADENMPTEEIKLSGNANVVDVLAHLSIFNSKSEIRHLIEQNGISIDDRRLESIDENIDLTKKELIVKKGKKTFLKVIIS